MFVIIHVSSFFCKSSLVCCMQESSTDPSWLSIHFPQCIHGHKCTWMDTWWCSSVRWCLCIHSSWIWFHVKSWILFWGQNDVFGFAIVFLVRMAQLWWVSQFPAETDSLSHKSYLFVSLQQHHFLHFPFHFGVFCFLMMLSGKFSKFSWYKLICNNYRCCCSVFSIPVSFLQILFSFTLSSLIFGKFCFWNSLCREASFAGLLIVDLLSLGWAVWKWTSLAAEKRFAANQKCALFVCMAQEYIHSWGR